MLITLFLSKSALFLSFSAQKTSGEIFRQKGVRKGSVLYTAQFIKCALEGGSWKDFNDRQDLLSLKVFKSVDVSCRYYINEITVCPGSSDPPEKIFDIFASENEVYTIY